MGSICKWFACVYAMRGGCIIKGWMSPEGPLNGKKAHCSIYDVMCINAKHASCGHKGINECKIKEDQDNES